MEVIRTSFLLLRFLKSTQGKNANLKPQLTLPENLMILRLNPAMKEKISEYPIDHPLTADRRRKIDQFIQSNVGRLGRAVSSEWDESGTVLLLASDPVEWEFIFHPNRVEAFGSAPFWVKMLFTEKWKNTVNQVVLQMLEEAGFIASSPARSPKAAASAPPARARKKPS